MLGANGSGKSRLLQRIIQSVEAIFGPERTAVHIEGGRAVQINGSVGLDTNTMQVYSNVSQAQQQYRHTRRATLASRINRTFVLLEALEREQKQAHSDRVVEWQSTDRLGDAPSRETPPMTRLAELFQEVFPAMKISVRPDNHLYVKKGDAEYLVSQMSEGERQVFTLLAEIALLTNERSVFFVDEPELNLHPTLAERLWVSLEEAFPDDIFVYATHSLPFAMRSGVDAVFALGHGQIDMTKAHADVDLRPFLGSIPGIVRAKHCIFVEGEEQSFDATLYRWLLGRDDVEVIPVGASNEVMSAAARSGIWQQLSAGINVCGIVDRDYKPTNAANNNRVLVLPAHEAESLLCHPALVQTLQAKLGIVADITEGQVLDELVRLAEGRLPYVVAQRVFARSYINLRLSLAKTDFAAIQTVDDLRPSIAAAAASEADKAHTAFNAGGLDTIISEEETRCVAAISSRDVDGILTLFEGKRALASLSKLAGCPSPQTMLRAAIKHLAVDNFAHLSSLKRSLLSLLA
ncbi:uncharacterized protein DUF4435 [Paraburkholderia sp. BL21I4N1]|nr:uncharacterized protein DUF4435 [Paraburkholderia sp. BL21I4N1]